MHPVRVVPPDKELQRFPPLVYGKWWWWVVHMIERSRCPLLEFFMPGEVLFWGIFAFILHALDLRTSTLN